MNQNWVAAGEAMRLDRQRRGDTRHFDALRLGVSVGELVEMERGEREPVVIDEEIRKRIMAGLS